MQQVVPEDFHIDLYFNATLLDADHAIPILRQLETTYRNFAICEGPINDIEGSKRLREAFGVPIAHHGGTLKDQLRQDYCDGFDLTGGANSIMRKGVGCGAFDKPFWLQQVGSAPQPFRCTLPRC